jgi:AcrR family transcriptional regulator
MASVEASWAILAARRLATSGNLAALIGPVDTILLCSHALSAVAVQTGLRASQATALGGEVRRGRASVRVVFAQEVVQVAAQSARTGAGRARSPRGQGEQLRREILAAVDTLLMEWGSADKLTVRAVAKEVGVAAPSIYLHFSDKAELVWAALSDKYDELVGKMAAADRAADGTDPREPLRAQAHAYCRFAMDDPGHYRLMFEVRQPAVGTARISGHPARHVSASLRAGFLRCQEAGYGLSMPVAQAAQTLWAGLHGAVSLHHSLFHDDSTEALTLSLADGLLDSLVAPEGSPVLQPSPAETAASRHIKAILSGTAGLDRGEQP